MSGALHAYGCVHDRHDDRDRRFSRLASVALGLTPLPVAVDLRDAYGVPVRDQGQLGSCTGFALTTLRSMLDRVRSPGAPVPPELSPLWLYYFERRRERTITEDSGAQIRDGLLTLGTYGCAPETDCPYDPALFAVAPSRQADTDARAHRIESFHRVNGLIEVKQALAMGKPVAAGIQVFASFESTDANATGAIPVPDVERESLLGGHAICLVGYDDTRGTVTFQNSWGTTWGAAGIGTLPYGYFAPSLGAVMDLWTATV